MFILCHAHIQNSEPIHFFDINDNGTDNDNGERYPSSRHHIGGIKLSSKWLLRNIFLCFRWFEWKRRSRSLAIKVFCIKCVLFSHSPFDEVVDTCRSFDSHFSNAILLPIATAPLENDCKFCFVFFLVSLSDFTRLIPNIKRWIVYHRNQSIPSFSHLFHFPIFLLLFFVFLCSAVCYAPFIFIRSFSWTALFYIFRDINWFKSHFFKCIATQNG